MTLLETALTEFSKGPDHIDAWLAEHPDSLKPAFVDQLTDYALAETQQGNLQSAFSAHFMTTLIHYHNGDRKKALRSKVHEVEIFYMLADSTDAYSQSFELANDVVEKTISEKIPEVEFSALGIAADSAYWCSTTVTDVAQRKHWLQTTIDTILTAAPPPVDDAPDPWSRFVSCIVATYQTITQEEWGPDQENIDHALRNLATFVERLVPVDFSFDDPQKTAHVAHHLVELSIGYGSRTAADERQRAANQVVKSDEWSG